MQGLDISLLIHKIGFDSVGTKINVLLSLASDNLNIWQRHLTTKSLRILWFFQSWQFSLLSWLKIALVHHRGSTAALMLPAKWGLIYDHPGCWMSFPCLRSLYRFFRARKPPGIQGDRWWVDDSLTQRNQQNILLKDIRTNTRTNTTYVSRALSAGWTYQRSTDKWSLSTRN